MTQLYPWPGLRGRGEFIRLALEQAGAACLASPRRLAFNQQGNFRRYAELDAG